MLFNTKSAEMDKMGFKRDVKEFFDGYLFQINVVGHYKQQYVHHYIRILSHDFLITYTWGTSWQLHYCTILFSSAISLKLKRL